MLGWMNFHILLLRGAVWVGVWGGAVVWSVLVEGPAVLGLQRSIFEEETWNEGSVPRHYSRDTEAVHPQRGLCMWDRQVEFSTVCWQSKRGGTWSESSSSPPPSLYASVNNKLYAVTFLRDRDRKCNSMFNIMLPKLTQIGRHRVDICCTQLGDLLLFKILVPLCFTDLPVDRVLITVTPCYLNCEKLFWESNGQQNGI